MYSGVCHVRRLPRGWLNAVTHQVSRSVLDSFVLLVDRHAEVSGARNVELLRRKDELIGDRHANSCRKGRGALALLDHVALEMVDVVGRGIGWRRFGRQILG